MSIHKYVVRTTSTSGFNAAIAVDRYIDDELVDTTDLLYTAATHWVVFDDLIQVGYATHASLKWSIQILGDIENYSVGDYIDWGYAESVNYTLQESEPTPPPPPPGPGFDIVLMNNTEELNKISKSPTTVMTVTGVLREETNIVNPEINIFYDGTLTNVNYMYIAALNRYYFITGIESIRTGIWRVYAHCDVLKTYAEGILDTEAVVARSESKYNLYLNDSMFKVYSNPRLQIANFPNKFTGESYVLVMNGAKYTAPT